MRKLAVFDLRLHYPPQGGACVDLFNILAILQKDFEIKIFTPDKGEAQFTEEPPIPVEKIKIPPHFHRDMHISFIRKTILNWNPDCVFIADGWTFKAYLADSFINKVPLVLRLYAYELLCPRNNEKWLFDHPCDSNALENTAACRKCAEDYAKIVMEKKNGMSNPLIDEARFSGIFSDELYGKIIRRVLSSAEIITYNSFTANILKNKLVNPKVHVIPGGFDPESIPLRTNYVTNNEVFSIFVPGRMNDPAKGASTAIKAGEILAKAGLNFKMKITMNPSEQSPAWLNQCGWMTHCDTLEEMRKSDCVLVPSIWEEAFGMTWVEAMASGTAVIAGNVAGPAEYSNGKALLFKPGNAEDLALKIKDLAGNPDKRIALAKAGSEYVRQRFTWENAAELTKQAILSAIGN